jgi:hypothetical protein
VESGCLFTVTSILNLIAVFLLRFVGAVTDAIVSMQIERMNSRHSHFQNFSTAGIAFNLILIRVYAQRVDGRDSQADSQQANTKPMSALQFLTPIDPTLTGTSSISEVGRNARAATDMVDARI